MTMPSGVTVGQGVGAVVTPFRAVDGFRQRTYSGGMLSASDKGSAVVKGSAAYSVDLAGSDATIISGVLADTVFDPAGIPATVADKLYGNGIYYLQVGQPVSVWKIGEFFSSYVDGTVAEGDFLGTTSAGKWKSTTTTNPFKNGSAVCTVGNGATAGAPIQFIINVA